MTRELERRLTVIRVEGDHVPLLVDCKIDSGTSKHQDQERNRNDRMHTLQVGEGWVRLTGVNLVVVGIGHPHRLISPPGFGEATRRWLSSSRLLLLPHAGQSSFCTVPGAAAAGSDGGGGTGEGGRGGVVRVRGHGWRRRAGARGILFLFV
jgi:hypothetical protein